MTRQLMTPTLNKAVEHIETICQKVGQTHLFIFKALFFCRFSSYMHARQCSMLGGTLC